jgi:hypothetical protein
MQRSKDSTRPKKAPAPTKTALRAERAKIAVPHPGLQFGHKHHVFIAKLKRGEVWALNQLKPETKIAVSPLFEMWPPTPGTKTKPAKSLQQHSTDLIQMLASEWTGLPCYIDTQYLQSAGSPSSASLQTVFSIARLLNVNAMPVTSPLFPPAFQQAISAVTATDGRGVMFRLPLTFFNDPQNVGAYLNGLATAVGVPKGQIDILVDLAYRPNMVEVQQMGAFCLDNLPFVDDWRTVTLAAGCFPDSISTDPTGQWVPYDRSDWRGWFAVAGQRYPAEKRIPSYGDYGVRCGGVPVVIPNSPAPNIRYTNAQEIQVRKGPKAPLAMRAICANLVAQGFFSGAAFSQGDSEIALKAATTGPANGSPEQWIQWCTNHHLELTASQILTLP